MSKKSTNRPRVGSLGAALLGSLLGAALCLVVSPVATHAAEVEIHAERGWVPWAVVVLTLWGAVLLTARWPEYRRAVSIDLLSELTRRPGRFGRRLTSCESQSERATSLRPAFLLACLLAVGASAGAQWTTEVVGAVDEGFQVHHSYSSLAIDGDGWVHISFRGPNDDLRRATNRGGTWSEVSLFDAYEQVARESAITTSLRQRRSTAPEALTTPHWRSSAMTSTCHTWPVQRSGTRREQAASGRPRLWSPRQTLRGVTRSRSTVWEIL